MAHGIRIVLLVACSLLAAGCSKTTHPVAPRPDTSAPGAIADLVVVATDSSAVELRWTAPGNDGRTGQAAAYEIRFGNTDLVSRTDWSSWTVVATPPAPVSPGRTQEVVVAGLAAATEYAFCVRTRDAAGNWSQPSNFVIGRTAGFRTGPVILVATGDATRAVYSDNGGRTWHDAALAGYSATLPASFFAFAVDPSDPAVVYANAGGLATGPVLGGNGIQKSVDGGRTWQPTTAAVHLLYGSSCCAVALTGSDPPTLYALASGVCLDVPFQRCCNCGGAVYRSTDGGTGWTDVSGNLPQAATSGYGAFHQPFDVVAVDPFDPSRVYVGGQAVSGSVASVYASSDGGSTWSPADVGLGAPIRVHALEADPGLRGHVLLACEAGIFLSRDAGASWSRRLGIAGARDFTFDTAHPGTVYTPISRSFDGGETWDLMATPPGARARIAMDPARHELYAAGADGVYRSADEGQTWTIVLASPGCSALAILPDGTGGTVHPIGLGGHGLLGRR